MRGWNKHPHHDNLPVVGTTEVQLLPAISKATIATGKGGKIPNMQDDPYAENSQSKKPLKPTI